MQKITAGRLGGRKLLNLPPVCEGVRPSSSRVRSAIFDRLHSRIVGSRILDLFAGSGALAIEGLSRGAAWATLVEKQTNITRFLEKQMRTLELEDSCQIICSDCLMYLKRSAVQHAYDLVLVDPPYADTKQYSVILRALASGNWLTKDHVVVCEGGMVRGRARKGGLSEYDGWMIDAERRHGDTTLLFMHYEQ